MVLGGMGAVDGQGNKNFFIVEAKTRAAEIQEKFEEYTKRKDVSIILIAQV
jgi:V-type H+-transporting ATPase subunit F